jgi:hypothetical protein
MAVVVVVMGDRQDFHVGFRSPETVLSLHGL